MLGMVLGILYMLSPVNLRSTTTDRLRFLHFIGGVSELHPSEVTSLKSRCP